MADERAQMVSLNDVVDLARIFNREAIGRVVDVGPLADCDSRCGCIGGNCECRGGVWSKWDRFSWQEFQVARQERIAELKQQLESLESIPQER